MRWTKCLSNVLIHDLTMSHSLDTPEFFSSMARGDVPSAKFEPFEPRVFVDRCLINQFNHPFDLPPNRPSIFPSSSSSRRLDYQISTMAAKRGLSCRTPQHGTSRITFPRTFISDVHSTLAGNGTDCGRWDHRAAGASCSPPVRPSCIPSSRPDCTPRSDLRTMAETLHVTTVRSLSRDRRGGIGKACRIPTKKHRSAARFFLPSEGEGTLKETARCEKSGSNQLCIWLTADVTCLFSL